ncbi:M48 family metalloprotease [Sneathiella limimaris]|uniref:M48 family metalloprotease n=1 Tax=Sneathiella limimaris TaxID=1964213 RepID=UPI00146AF3A1|nr:M48 family metalloprotease [Sneathiella limimaris]
MNKRFTTFLSVILVSAFFTQPVAANQPKLSYIRDAEIEHTLRSYATPLFTAAGLNANDVSIHLINNKVINAFVAGGQRMFFFTGLLERVESPSQLKGIIAHETGHIAGGHLARTQEALKNATTKSIIGYLLGAAAVIAGGAEGGVAVVGGAQALAQKSFLKYSREQESSADQASLRYLERTGTSGRGMMEFLRILEQNEQISYGKVDPYWRSHPINNERIAALARQVEKSPYRDVPDSPQDIRALKFIQAKLVGFTENLRETLKQYPPEDKSEFARYARAIAYFRHPDIEKGLKEIDSLLLENPTNPYFYELKGQMLYENGNIAASLAPLKTATEIAPYEPLILTLYGTSLIANNQPQTDQEAVDTLKTALAYDPNNSRTWYQLATAYSRIGDEANLALASAERFMLLGNAQKASFHAKRAQNLFPVGTPGYLRADDIIAISKNLLKDKS